MEIALDGQRRIHIDGKTAGLSVERAPLENVRDLTIRPFAGSRQLVGIDPLEHQLELADRIGAGRKRHNLSGFHEQRTDQLDHPIVGVVDLLPRAGDGSYEYRQTECGDDAVERPVQSPDTAVIPGAPGTSGTPTACSMPGECIPG